METKSYVGKDFYNSYLEYIDNNELYYIDYKIFRNIINDYFKFLKDELIENGKEIKLPCRMGYIKIVKHKPKEWNNKSLSIDYHSTRELGKLIYHLNEHSDGFKYRLYWNKQSMLISNKTKYQIILTRYNKRRLAFLIKNHEQDYIEI